MIGSVTLGSFGFFILLTPDGSVSEQNQPSLYSFTACSEHWNACRFHAKRPVHAPVQCRACQSKNKSHHRWSCSTASRSCTTAVAQLYDWVAGESTANLTQPFNQQASRGSLLWAPNDLWLSR